MDPSAFPPGSPLPRPDAAPSGAAPSGAVLLGAAVPFGAPDEAALPVPAGPDAADAGTAASAGGHQRPNQRPVGYWVDDEGLLRDEGALFGFAAYREGEDASLLDAKLGSIHGRFAPLVGAEEAALAALAEDLDRRTALRDACRADAAACRALAAEVDAPDLDAFEPAAAHQRLRFAASGVLALAGAAFSGWIVYDHLHRSGLAHPALVSAAVTLLGYAGPFQPLSVLHTRHDVVRARPDHAEVWKLHASEWMLPLAAAAFVALYAQPAVGTPRAVAVGALLVAAFVVVGKLLTSTLTRFAVARRRGREEAARAREHEKRSAHEAARAAEHDAAAADHDAHIAALHDRMDAHEQEIARLRGAAEYKAQLFLSEYRFALATMHRRAAAGDGVAARPASARLTVDPLDGAAFPPH